MEQWGWNCRGWGVLVVAGVLVESDRHTHARTHIQQTQTYRQRRREATKQKDTADMHTERTQIQLQHFTWNMCHDIAFSRIHLLGRLFITCYKVLTKCLQQHESNTSELTQSSAKIRAVYGDSSSTEWDHCTTVTLWTDPKNELNTWSEGTATLLKHCEASCLVAPVTVPICNVTVHQPTPDYTSAPLQEGEGLKHWNVAKTRLSAGVWLLFKADWLYMTWWCNLTRINNLLAQPSGFTF